MDILTHLTMASAEKTADASCPENPPPPQTTRSVERNRTECHCHGLHLNKTAMSPLKPYILSMVIKNLHTHTHTRTRTRTHTHTHTHTHTQTQTHTHTHTEKIPTLTLQSQQHPYNCGTPIYQLVNNADPHRMCGSHDHNDRKTTSCPENKV